MYRPPRHLRPQGGGVVGGGGGGFAQPFPSFPQNPYFLHQQAYQNYINPTPFFPSAPNPSMSFPPYLQNPAIPNQTAQADPREVLGRIESAVAKAHQDILASGENVSAWKLSQSALLSLKVDCWSSLGFQIQDIPYLHRLLVTEGKVDAFIHCFVGARRITSVHDLDVAICANEGIESFEVLGLGPLLRHPLVVHYFSVPSDATEVSKLTSEEIVSCLGIFMDKCKKTIPAEDFLSFLMEKHSVTTKEKLGVRIRSLGLHITFIREAKKAENYTLRASSESLRHSYDKKIGEEEMKPQPPCTVSAKIALDRKFDSISNRVKYFSASLKDLGNSHIRFDSSDDDDDCQTCSNQPPSQDKDSTQRVSSCPYPSTTEEMARLGLKTETEKVSSGKKRKFEEQKDDSTPSILGQFIQDVKDKKSDIVLPSHLKHSFTLTSTLLEDFATTWKEACQEHSIVEVLSMMLNFYGSMTKKKKRKRLCAMIEIFSLMPGIGLLNIAVASIKHGMLKKNSDTFKSIGEDECVNPSSCKTAEMDVDPLVKRSETSYNSVTIDDVIEKVSTYFGSDQLPPIDKELFLGKKISLLKRFRDCETWLMTQFSIQEFNSLGFGDFFGFLERNVSLLPYEIQNYLLGDTSQKSTLVVSMFHDQLKVFLSQAGINFLDKENITKHYISMLLRNQYPTIGFHIMENEPEELFPDVVKRLRDSYRPSSVLFSTALLGKHCLGCSLARDEKILSEDAGMTVEVAQHACFPRPSSEDAIKCLIKAPILSDLQSWSHWDLVYGPYMGPLLDWLLSDIHCKDLLCIATRDGKLIRVDHSATADEFLEAAIQGSSFQTAVKLISLIPLYGGTSNVPLSLLKHFASRAIEVMIRNSTDCMEAKMSLEGFKHGRPLLGQPMFNGDPNMDLSLQSDELQLQESQQSAFSAASSFILDCLSYLPSEFHSFASEILVSGLQSFTRDAYRIILRECKQTCQRLMLHNIGLSLGIMEWVEDYNAFITETASELVMSNPQPLGRTSGSPFPEYKLVENQIPNASESERSINRKMVIKPEIDSSMLDDHLKVSNESPKRKSSTEGIDKKSGDDNSLISYESRNIQDATLVIESIRHEEFGLDPNIEHLESNLLKKQHARLGRALHCLSQELYSHDSHLLLELIQNADDNFYPENVDPSLVFILQANGIVVLNNEQGFSAQNIRALCDIGNSTKKGSSAGYIGRKGIGFKSVFRVTDAPEIHSNGFHVKFDISEGQIGFVLPTLISPCDLSVYSRQVYHEIDHADAESWKTCIVLPFQPKLKKGAGISSIISLFSDLHPSLLLFLHRLQCIQFKNMLNDTLVVLRRETLRDGIVRVSHGNEKMSWLVVRKKLQASLIRADVQSTEIAIAFTLQDSGNGEYQPHLSQQPVFAYLPLRQYGLKFILQGDFVLPSSREEVDGDSPWNQWLLSEFPTLFVGAKKSFCDLPCFKESPGKAVSTFMSFVPLAGQVHGFFSHLPNMIVSKLRISNCLLTEGHSTEWVPPCRVLRGWDEQACLLLSDSMLEQHLGLGYLRKDIVLSDALARSLGIKNYGPKILIEIISSLCHTNGSIKLLGFDWLSSWLVALNTALSMNSGGCFPNTGMEFDFINNLKKIPFIPLSDGSYGSVAEAPIWLPSDSSTIGCGGEQSPKDFPHLYGRLRTVNQQLFSANMSYINDVEERRVDSLTRMLHRIGVQQLSAHEIIKTHILCGLADDGLLKEDISLMTEYLCFFMLHLQHDCRSCCIEKDFLIVEMRKRYVILTNHGYKCPIKEPIHFSKEFGNPVDINRLIDSEDIEWHEVDAIYLKHPSTQTLTSRLVKWREFFMAMGVTDFVQVTRVDKNGSDVLSNFSEIMIWDGDQSTGIFFSDWESPELVRLLSILTLHKNLEKCKYLLEVFDNMWDDYYGSQATGYIIFSSADNKRPVESSFMKSIRSTKWIASSMDKELHFPKDVYFDCETVRSILGAFAPYALPQVSSKKLWKDIGFKTQVTLDDALKVLQSWSMSANSFITSADQMSKFYNFIWDKFSSSREEIVDHFKASSWIFVPFICKLRCNDVVPGSFFYTNEVYWHDPTGCVDRTKEIILQRALKGTPDIPYKALATVYPSLHDFFVNECGVHDVPPFGSYVEILQQLSSIALPSQAAYAVFRVLLKWADDLKNGIVNHEEVNALKQSISKVENKVLPTMQDKWVSLHTSFGFICWSDDEELRLQFKHSDNIDFLQFGELNIEEKEMLSGKIASLMRRIGIPALSEVVSREAIIYGTRDNQERVLLVNWVLPYAQRYIFKLFPDAYQHLKQFGLEKLGQLQVSVVEKLFYKHTLKGHGSTSKKRFECSSLLQGNILYTTHNSDSHSIFLELSRVFFDGSANLHLANFLHMITTMAESGSSEDKIEFFIVNSQKVPKLPSEEPLWSLLLVQSVHQDKTLQQNCPTPIVSEENSAKVIRKLGTVSNWPPTDWKNAPGFGSGLTYQFRIRPELASNGCSLRDPIKSTVDIFSPEDVPVNVDIDGDWVLEDNSALTTPTTTATTLVLQDPRNTRDQCHLIEPSDSIDSQNGYDHETKIASDDSVTTVSNAMLNMTPSTEERLSVQNSNEEESYKTGRLGEAAAYRYFSNKLKTVDVKWVNKEVETGLPYDLLIGENEVDREYIEVKTTKSKSKNWFPITLREWQFALEKGDAFSIARVVLMGPKNAQITILKNPIKLCQKNILRLAILMS